MYGYVAVVAHTLENTIKAVAKQTALLSARYGQEVAQKLFRLDSVIAFKRKRVKKADGGFTEVTENTPVFLDASSRDLLVRRFKAKLAAHNPTDKRFVVAFGGHSSAAAHGE